MHPMKLILALAVGQVCTLGAVATLLSGCGQDPPRTSDLVAPTGGNRAPIINSLTAMPEGIFVGNVSNIRAQASDPDGDAITWSLAVNPGTNRATGIINVRTGSGGDVSATFTASTVGELVGLGPGGQLVGAANILLSIFDNRQGIATSTLVIQVFPPGREP